jgi:3-hydroxybutyryl-CoA dehydrogenase
MDFSGLDMAANSLNNKKYVPAPDPGQPAMIFDHYNKGEYGVKSGKGFYDYSDRSYTEVLRQRDKKLLESVQLGNRFLAEPLHKK